MKILLDESVPWPLNNLLPAQDCVSVQQRGWTGVKNGELLKRAAVEFDLLSLRTKDFGINKTWPRFAFQFSSFLPITSGGFVPPQT